MPGAGAPRSHSTRSCDGPAAARSHSLARIVQGNLLTAADYNNLGQCDTLDDIKLNLNATDYGPYVQNEPSPLQVSRVVDRCTQKLVDEFKHLRAHATGSLADFLDYLTYGPMIDNVVLIVMGTLHERQVEELVAKCHPLGMFDSIASLAVASSMQELYRLVLVDTPLGKYFSNTLSSEDLDEMNIEILRNTLYRAYLDDFHQFCLGCGGATATIMDELLSIEADKRAITITVNSIGTELTRDDRRRLFSSFGALAGPGHEALAACDDFDQVRAVVERVPQYSSMFSRISQAEAQAMDKAFYEVESKKLVLSFEQQFHFAIFYSYFRLREQEIRNLMWVAECVAQNQKSRVHDGIVVPW